jgi:hypothetical protein
MTSYIEKKCFECIYWWRNLKEKNFLEIIPSYHSQQRSTNSIDKLASRHPIKQQAVIIVFIVRNYWEMAESLFDAVGSTDVHVTISTKVVLVTGGAGKYSIHQHISHCLAVNLKSLSLILYCRVYRISCSWQSFISRRSRNYRRWNEQLLWRKIEASKSRIPSQEIRTWETVNLPRRYLRCRFHEWYLWTRETNSCVSLSSSSRCTSFDHRSIHVS